MWKYSALFFPILTVLRFSLANAQIPAFPGAEGFGSTTPGGRGGQVIKVTNLNESGPGSFRAAVEASGPRIVVFDVGGTIDMLGKPLRITNPYLTIAGQTAPGDGILLKDSDLAIMTHDVIIRGLRIRVGDSGTDPSNTYEQRGLLMGGDSTYNIIIDHCSISWGRGGNLYAFRGAHDITFSWNNVAEALKLEGSKGVTHHNVIVRNNIRSLGVFAMHNEVGGYPEMDTGTPPPDTDDDGMPDDWKPVHGLNPNDASDVNGDADGDTNIGEYISGLIPLPAGI